jgi:uncharacterized YccA/Bax inhibitor family protein
MRSSNPVLTRLDAPGQTRGYGSPVSTYPSPVVSAAGSDRMTIDDVVVRTVGLLIVTALSGAAIWAAVDTGAVSERLVSPIWIGAALVGVVIGLIISFRRITNPPLILAYAVVEGVAVGMFSMWFESRYPGIILQALIGTFGIFLVMTALYRFRVIRNSPRFSRGVIAAMSGIFVLILVSWVLSFFGINTHLRDGGTFSIIFSLVVIVVASLTFILDFDLIEQSIRYGAPKSTAWTCAFGLLVGLIWVYLEVVRLLSYLRGRN